MPTREKDGDGGSGDQQRSFLEAPAPHYTGHRARLRERFLKGGADAMPDYELLELVLFRALPRRDTKELAKQLIARFGSFAEVVNAPDQRLKEINGVGESVITELRLIRAASLRLMRSNVLRRPALSSWKQVLDYLRAPELRASQAVSCAGSSTRRTSSSLTRCNSREPSITRPSMRARWLSAPSSCRQPRLCWCTITPPATPPHREWISI